MNKREIAQALMDSIQKGDFETSILDVHGSCSGHPCYRVGGNWRNDERDL